MDRRIKSGDGNRKNATASRSAATGRGVNRNNCPGDPESPASII
jgi:hypothetical protein